ncbi:hypothetical protein [Burkholderia cenocepacia]|uniref:hypothetical protein n=1 Tax=Burkholderia cenocepacia TaxID=95486 RepID=UPI001E3DB26D|nr:hypothetical protein [Burkholderia cenocepacia]
MEQAYAAIGRAAIAMQMFEVAFVSIHEGFKMMNDEAYREATGGFITPEKYKTATANVVKVLSQRGQIAADLEDRLNTLIDRRNELLHRWILHKGWPANDDNDAASYAEVMQLAEWVHAEANMRAPFGHIVRGLRRSQRSLPDDCSCSVVPGFAWTR